MKTVINKYVNDFNVDFTIGFEVKVYGGNFELTDDDFDFENETGTFVNKYAEKCFKELQKLKYNWLNDFSFAGRSNGWFILLCNNKEYKNITNNQMNKIEDIVKKYFKNYVSEINNFYKNLT